MPALRVAALPWVLLVFVGAFSVQAGENRDSGRSAGLLEIRKPLLAYWNFDDERGQGAEDTSGHGYHASPDRRTANIERVPGLWGSALSFSGRHMLRVPERPAFNGLGKLSFSVWAAPTAFERYNELFRKEDGDRRVLFAFQDNGAILTLGLNVGGYVECDAKIDPCTVLDGAWHHCAGTFDGQVMRVYLDGRQVGMLKRPGTIASGGGAPGCIGSAHGGECFQGQLDDFRIYADTLTADEIAALHQNGMAAQERMNRLVAAGEPELARPLIAHWTFNEPSASSLVRNAAGDRALDVKVNRLARPKGVYGRAAELSGEHALAVHGLAKGDLAAISFSAWLRPRELRGYREIFRQECERRLLFAVQEDGAALTLGLNVNGYIECRAPVDPRRLRDGGWHHAAATFDGQALRVYFDGREIGRVARPGKVAIQAATTAYIGSSVGRSEHFQGGLDDLRIYAAGLTADEVAGLCRGGRETIARRAKELADRLAACYVPRPTLAETLMATRQRVLEKKLRLDRELADLVRGRFAEQFPDDAARFSDWTGQRPLEFVTDRAADAHERLAGRLVELLLEYKPLTEHQWRGQTAEDRRKWDEADKFRQRFEALKARGPAAQFSPEWIALMFDAGSRIQFRPSQREPVAPYITPATPETRTLTADETRDTLHRDWLHQADDNPTPERIRSEIQWAREMAERIGAGKLGRVDFSKELASLVQLEKQAAGLKRADVELYFQVRQLKRQIQFKNPAVNFSQVLMVDMPFPQGQEWRHETRHRLGYMAVPGGRLLVLDGLNPGGKVRQLMPQAPLHGSFWRPDLDWDGKRVLMSFKPHNEKSFHLYEINVDGTGLVQLTDGPYDDLDPIYLADGEHLLFSTTRGHTYVRCMPPTNAYILARCERSGRNIYLVSQNNEPDYLPSVANDGRVVYTRWEYTDKPLWRAQKLWTMNPDGTQVITLWGNQSVWPDVLKDARSIPGSHRVMFTGSAHHNWFGGSVGIVDPNRGFNFPHGLTKVTADVTWPETGNGPVDPIESARYHASGAYAAYYSPYPLSEQDFLVSAERGGKFMLFLMDVDGNRELVYEGVNNIFHAIPLVARRRPPLIADRVAWPDREHRLNPEGGVIYSGNVYQNAPAVLKNKARYLRVMQIEPKTYTYWHKRPYISTGPVVSAVQSEGVKRVMGTVPIEADGSVAFHVPPGKSLHFQLLDENYRALQTMRSFVGVMPGEYRGCLGCHESHSRSPAPVSGCEALTKRPRQITLPPWGEDTVSYPRYVQPVLDKYCGRCHQGDGEAVKTLDLTLRPGFLMFTEPYMTLIGRPTWGKAYARPENPPPGFGIANTILVEGYSTTDPRAYVTPPAMTFLSYRSRLVELAASGKHYGVKADPVSVARLAAWIDAMCPYSGDEEVRSEDDPEFPGVDWLSVRPRIKTAPRIVRPGPVD
jgi:hypothetical protein